MDYGDEYQVICDGKTRDKRHTLNENVTKPCVPCCEKYSCELNSLLSNDEEFLYYTCQ